MINNTNCSTVGSSPAPHVLLPLDAIKTPTAWKLRSVDPGKVAEVAEDIRTRGLLHPITLRAVEAGFELVAGQHRLEAVRALGWEAVPALVIATDDAGAEATGLAENVRRAQLTPAERTRGLHRLVVLQGGKQPRGEAGMPAPGTGVTRRNSGAQKAVAAQAGLSKAEVSRARARAERSAPEVAAAFDAGEISQSQVDELVQAPTEVQVKLLPKVVKGMTRRETRAEVKATKEKPAAEENPTARQAGLMADELLASANECYMKLSPEAVAAVPTEVRTIVAEAFEHLQALLGEHLVVLREPTPALPAHGPHTEPKKHRIAIVDKSTSPDRPAA